MLFESWKHRFPSDNRKSADHRKKTYLDAYLAIENTMFFVKITGRTSTRHREVFGTRANLVGVVAQWYDVDVVVLKFGIGRGPPGLGKVAEHSLEDVWQSTPPETIVRLCLDWGNVLSRLQATGGRVQEREPGRSQPAVGIFTS